MSRGGPATAGRHVEVLRLIDDAKLAGALLAAVRAGVLHHLTERPRSTAELAEVTGTQPRPLDALLRALAWGGLLTVIDGNWAIAEPSRPALAADAELGLHPLLRLEAWAAGDRLNVRGILDALQGAVQPPEVPDDVVADLADAMWNAGAVPALMLARQRDLDQVTTLVDVGGGPGRYAIDACRVRPALNALVLDRPPMVEIARDRISSAGLTGRVRAEVWELARDPVPSADGAVLSQVLHLLPESGRADVLSRVRDALPAGAPLFVHEFLAGSEAVTPVGWIVDWLVLGSGFDLSIDDLAAELALAGFETVRTVPVTATGTVLVVACRR